MEIFSAPVALTMTNSDPVLIDGAIAVELGNIRSIGHLDELRNKFPDAEIKDFPNSVLMPGLVNAHCHLDLISFYESQTVGDLPSDDADFIDTLISSIGFKRDVESKLIIDGIQRGIDRLCETGVTCVGDMTSFEGTFNLLGESGLRAVIFPEVLGGGGETAQHNFEVALALLEKYTDATYDMVRIGLGPYAPYLLSRNLLKILSRHARDMSIPMVIHAAESFAEMEFFFDSQGAIATHAFPSLGWKNLPPAHRKTPIGYLSDIGFFDAPTTIIGGIHLSAGDFPLLARNLVRVIYSPISNAFMKHGMFPYGKFLEYGIPIGMGTENWYEALGFNMWEEMRTAVRGGSEPLFTPKQAMQTATIGGARALGLDHLIGTLEEGKKADFIIVHVENVGSLVDDEDELYEQIVKETNPQHISYVVTGGNVLKTV